MKQSSHGISLPDRDAHFEDVLSRPKKKGDVGLYQPHIYRMVLAQLDPDRRRLAIDVGAHVGLLSLQMAEDFERVVAFEPWGENEECFVANLRGRENVTLHNAALGDHNGTCQLRIVPHNSGANFIDAGQPPHKWAAELVECQMRRLDSYGYVPDLIKIDVQGYEEQVLRGALGTIESCRPMILIEEAGLGDDEAAIRLLEKWGYEELCRWTKDRVMAWGG